MPDLARFTTFARKVGASVPDPESPWCEEDWQAAFDERAAILEYDGGLPRREAEKRARIEIDEKKKLTS